MCQVESSAQAAAGTGGGPLPSQPFGLTTEDLQEQQQLRAGLQGAWNACDSLEPDSHMQATDSILPAAAAGLGMSQTACQAASCPQVLAHYQHSLL